MKEIGGYFELEKFKEKPYYENVISLNTARNALLYICEARKIKRVYLPYYLCDSVVNTLMLKKIDYCFYHIDKNLMPILNFKINENEVVYLVNYFGQISNKTLLDIMCNVPQVILDNTHAFFQQPLKDVDTIYSCRKFFGVPDGAYLFTNCYLERKLKIDKSKGRMEHLLGRFEGNASEYYECFHTNEESLEKEYLKKMSNLTKNILGAIDYENVIKIRNENYMYLKSVLDKKNLIETNIISGAFCYPFYCENGLSLRKELSKKKIFIPILWPNVLNSCSMGTVEYQIASNILPIPCDQRYGINEMKFIINSLEKI